MTAQIMRLTRRTFGLVREVYIVRCVGCKWRAELPDMANAVSLVKKHVCRNHTERKPA